MKLDEAMNLTGFELCEFKPEHEDYCEKCNKSPDSILCWRRTDHFSNDGEYFCAECVASEAEAIRDEINKAPLMSNKGD